MAAIVTFSIAALRPLVAYMWRHLANNSKASNALK